jgi:hypothetical protein
MSDDLARNSSPLSVYARSSNKTVEAIIALQFPFLPVFYALGKLVKDPENENPFLELVQHVQEVREKLLALSSTELAKAHERELATAEAARFPGADLEYWTSLEYWTLGEAVALLLGRDPEKVTAKTLKSLQHVSPFPRAHDRLLRVAQRAHSMTNTDRLRPADVLAWAHQSGVVTAPPKLEQLIEAQTTQTAGVERGISTPTAPAPQGESVSLDLPARWTAETKAALQSYRAQHGTKAAAAHFGISPARVRQLLPTEPPKSMGNSVFNPASITRKPLRKG